MQLSEKEATALIHKQDEDRALWVQNLLETADPWSASLYDMVIPMDKMDVEEAALNIQNHLGDKMLQPSDESRKAAEDFLLASLGWGRHLPGKDTMWMWTRWMARSPLPSINTCSC